MTQPTHSEEFCERCWSFDPLTGTRRDDDPPLAVMREAGLRRRGRERTTSKNTLPIP